MGNTPPLAQPAITRNVISVSKLGAKAEATDATPSTTMQVMISRVLLSISAMAPIKGWISA